VGESFILAGRDNYVRMKLGKDSYFNFNEGAVYTTVRGVIDNSIVERVDVKLIWSKL
jgi:hypothetical protein